MYTENGETRRSVRKMGLVSREDEYLSVVDSVTLFDDAGLQFMTVMLSD